MYLSSPVVTKVPCSINVLSSVTQSLTKCNFSMNQPNHFLFSKKIQTKVSNNSGQSFQKVPTSNSNWKMGEPQKILSGKTLTFEPSVFTSSQFHQFLLNSVSFISQNNNILFYFIIYYILFIFIFFIFFIFYFLFFIFYFLFFIFYFLSFIFYFLFFIFYFLFFIFYFLFFIFFF